MTEAVNPELAATLKVIAVAFLEGRERPLETAYALARYEHDVPARLRDALTDMVMVESETDAVPLGERRARWHPDVRAREDRRHDGAQAWAAPVVRETCERLLAEL